MAGWRESRFATEAPVAAPVGAQQQSVTQDETRAAGGWQGSRFALEAAPRLPKWQSGGQVGSTENGWNTPFYQKMFDQRNARLDAGTIGDWYSSEDFTGVATWEGQKAADGRDIRLGDVYEDGTYRGNLLDPKSGYDEATGYQMLAQLSLSADEQKHAYERLRSNPLAVKEAVDARAAEDTRNVAAAQGSKAYQSEIDQQKSEWDDAVEGTLAIAAGAVGGAALGIFGGPIGIAAGAVVGGVAAAANKDFLVDQAARATVQTGMAAEQFGPAGGLSTGLQQWGGAALSAFTPLSNLTQGITDLANGGWDDSSAYYDMGAERPWWLTGLGITATLGDSLLQFASPVGQAAFKTAMGATVAGGAGQLAFQGGARFDDRIGNFDAPDDPGQWLAAIGAVGMDVVQLAGARGIARAVTSADRAALGTVDDASRLSLFNRTMPEGAVRTERIGGKQFYLDEAGQVVGTPRTTMTMLAPSEATMWASAKLQTQIMRAQHGGAISPQQANQLLYQAAKDIEGGTNLAKTALVNAFGEGLEEATQSVLEPLSHGWTPDGNDVIMSYLQGAAAGAGMSVGARVGSYSANERGYLRSQQIAKLNNVTPPTREQWDSWTPEQKRQATAAPPLVSMGLREAGERAAREQVMEAVKFDVGLEKSLDAALLTQDKEMRSLNPALEGTFTLGSLQSSDIPNHVVLSDFDSVVNLLQSNADSVRDQIAQRNPAPQLEPIAEAQAMVLEQMHRLQREFVSATPERQAQIVRDANEVIQVAWDSVVQEGDVITGSPYAKAVGVLLSRSPNNSAGSFQMLMPQVSLQDTLDGGQGLLKVSHAILKMIDGDFDGDMVRQHVQVAIEIEDDAYRALRLGLNALGMRDGSVKIGTRDTEEFIIDRLGLAAKGGVGSKSAEATLRVMSAWLKTNLATVPNIDTIVDETIDELRRGVVDAKQNLFQKLNTQASDEVIRLGERGNGLGIPPMSSVYMAIDQHMFSMLEKFKNKLAARVETDINYGEVAPILPVGQSTTREGISAATPGATMHQLTVGNDAFRAPQHLHYGDYRSPSETAGQRPDNLVDALVSWYEAISSGIGVSVRQSILSRDEISQRAMAILQSVARAYGLEGNGVVGAHVVAQLSMPNYSREGTEWTDQGGFISLGQWALREAARQVDHIAEYEEKAGLIQSLDADEAWVEIFDATPLIAVMGAAADNFGPQMTVGQLKAQYKAKDTFARRDFRERARTDYRYAGERHDAPYTRDELLELTLDEAAYKTSIDAIFAAADKELSADPRSGEINPNSTDYVRDQRMQKSLENAFEYTRRALADLAKLHRIKKLDVASVLRLLDGNPNFARTIADLLPTDIVNVVFEPLPDGRVNVARWFAEMLTQPPKQAVMTYFRNTLQAKLNVLGNETNPKMVDDRMVELVLQLQTDPPRLARFQELLLTSQDLSEFMATVNKEFRTGAPQLAWFRDVASFDPSRTAGGWSKQLPGAELRDAIRNFANAAVGFQDYASQELELDANDADLMTTLQHALAQYKSGKRSDSLHLLDTLQRSFATSAGLRPALGPGTLMRSVFGAISGFMGKMTDKGLGATYYETLSNIQALGYSPLQSIGYAQMLGAMTTWDADDAAANMGLFAGQNLRLADREGRIIEWTALSNAGQGRDKYQDVERFLEMWKDPAYRPMLRAAVFPTAFETLENGGMSQQLLTKMGLRDLVGEPTEGTVYDRMLGSNANRDVLRYAAQIDALTSKYGRNFGLQRYAADLAIARTSTASRTLTPDELEAIANEAMLDVARMLRAAAAYGKPEEIAKMVSDATRRLSQNLSVDESFGSDVAETIRDGIYANALSVLPENASPEQIKAAEQRDEILARVVYGNDNLFRDYAQAYLIDWSDGTTSLERMRALNDEVQNNPAIAQSTLSDEVRMLTTATATDATGLVPVLAADPELNRERWDAVARAVLAYKFTESIVGVTSTRVAMSTLPKTVTYESVLDALTGDLKRDTLGHARYMDQSFRYLTDAIADPKSPELLAAQDFLNLTIGEGQRFTLTDRDELEMLINRVVDPEKLGRWTPEIMRQSVDAQNRIDSSGASRQVSSSGILYAKYAAPIAATHRTYLDPESAGVKPRVFTLSPVAAASLRGDALPSLLEDGLFGEDGHVEPLAMLNGRFLARGADAIVVTYRDAAGNTIQANLRDAAAISPDHEFQGEALGRRVGLASTSLEELSASLGSLVPNDATEISVQVSIYHPADLPPGAEWANNLFFEGEDGIGDTYESLLASGIMGIDGENVIEQLASLKANKKGTDALINPKLPTAEDIALLEELGDVYEVLKAKTLFVLSHSLGHRPLDPKGYNFLFKDLKMRHALLVTDASGNQQLLSADEAIRLQATSSLPEGSTARLITLSPRTLNTLLGEQNTQGLLRPMLEAPTIDSAATPVWTGSLTPLLRKVPGIVESGSTVNLLNTRVGARGAMSQSSVRPPYTPAELQAQKRRLETWRNYRVGPDASRERNAEPYVKRRVAAMETLQRDQNFLTGVPQYALRQAGIAMNLPIDADPRSSDLAAQTAFAQLNATLQGEEFSTAWQVQYKPGKLTGGRVAGVLSGLNDIRQEPGDHEAAGQRLLHRDLAIVHVDTFPQDPIERKRELISFVRELADKGVSIALIDSTGSIDSRTLTPADLDKIMYRTVPGTRGLFVPFDPTSNFRTLEALYSRLTETEELWPDSFATVFHSRTLSVTENAALANKLASMNGRELVLTSSLAPINAYDQFGVAATQEQRVFVSEQLNAMAVDPRTIDHLLAINPPEKEPGRRVSTRQARKDADARAELTAALRRAASSYDVGTGLPAVGSDFGTGDIIVLVGPGNRLILVRHGHEPIRDLTELSAQLAAPANEGGAASNVAIYGTRTQENATAYSGKIRAWVPENGYGLSVRQSIAISELGNKEVLQRNGAKLVISGGFEEAGLEVPAFGPLRNFDLNFATHWADTASKENYDGLIVSAREAFAFLGMDFVPAYAESLLGISRPDWDALKPAEQQRIRQDIQDLFKELARQAELDVAAVESLRNSLFNPDDAFTAAMSRLSGSLGTFNTAVLTKPVAQRTPADQVTLAALVYLQYKQARPSDVMGAPGFDAPRVGNNPVSVRLPELFTATFDKAPLGSPLRGYIFNELNLRLNNKPGLEDGSGYQLKEDWTFLVTNKDASMTHEGYLQFAELHTSGHTPELKAQSRDRNRTEAASRQQTLMIEETLGAHLYRAKDLRKTEAFVTRSNVTKVQSGRDVLAVMNNERLRQVPTYSLTRQLLPAERVALEVNRDARIQFEQPADESEWTTAEKAEAATLRNGIVLDMGLTEASASRVDAWVRAWLGRPAAAPGQDPTIGSFSFRDFKDAVELGIRPMLSEGRYPVDRASQSMMGLSDVLLLARAHKPGNKWQLRGADGTVAQSLEDFVLVALNPNRNPPEPLFQTAADGYMNTFREMGDLFANLPVSMDPVRSAQLQTANIGNAGATISSIFGGRLSGGVWQGDYPPSSGLDAAQKRFAAYRKKNSIPEPVPLTMEQLRSGGWRFVTQGTSSNALMRILTNMRAANGMFNPWLYVTAPVESGIKNFLEVVKDTLTGDAFVGGKDLQQRAAAVDRALGENQGFMGMINQDILVHAKLHNAGWAERTSAKLAGIAGRWQDPSYGMKQSMMAKRYRMSVMSNAMSMGSRMTLTPEQLLNGLQTDPQFVKKNYRELHQYAINRIANLRSLKPTVLSLLLMKNFIDPLTHNPRVIVNIPATLGLKLPFLFFNYASNAATNMLGLQALNAVSAVALNSPSIKKGLGHARAWLKGESKDYNAAIHDIDFVAETMENVNLADAVIQSGLTHTALMGLGLLTGSLGLNGEDDEDKRRRRAAQAEGAGWVYDPREIVNDWRNADALYLDNLPDWFPFAEQLKQMYKVGVDQDGEPVSMVQLHWTLKQFISPMMGIDNYLTTGNFAHVLWGFEDALGSMPLINETGFDEAARIATELENAARDAESRGNPVDLVNSFGFMINGVMALERMLLENSFVNSIYTAADQYDRDPYTLADLNDTGEIQRDDNGQPMKTDALQQFVNDAGEPAVGSLQASPTEARIKTLTENRASLALFTSLFTGLADSEYIRYNMAVKTRKVDGTELTENEAISVIMSMWDPKQQREVLTTEGGMAVIKGLQMGTLRPGDPAMEGLYLSYEDRQKIANELTAKLTQEYLDLGLSKDVADEQVRQTFYGSETNPYATPLNDVIFNSDYISYNPTTTYKQLNTTYVTGPDGMPWATGIARSSLENFFGQAPLQTYNSGQLGGGLDQDSRLNSTDSLANVNTGMRNLEREHSSVANPTMSDLQELIDKNFQEVLDAVNHPSWTNYADGVYGRSRYSRSGGYGGGGGGGGGWSYRLNGPERGDVTYNRGIPFVNTSNPIIRRSTIRRERFSSERGRLNQWQ